MLLSAVLIHSASLGAGVVSVDRAKTEADAFLKAKAFSRAVPVTELTYVAAPSDKSTVRSSYYIFNQADDGGFVIVSADDRVDKILAYSERGSFSYDNMPPAVADMLAGFDTKVEGLSADMPVHDSWIRTETVGLDEKVLPTAKWAQYEPFNNLCPSGGYPSGCTATAMAIVMKYHNWPERGRGSNSYEWNGETLSMDFDQKFDWDNMLDKYSDVTYTDTQADAVAGLMKACGVALEMNYNMIGSGATVTPYIMHRYFRYSPNAINNRVVAFSDNDIVSRIKDEINAGRPMICSGGYHCFVCDGYSGDLLHFNFGWAGWDDGFYNMKALSPLSNAAVDYVMTGIEPYREEKIYPPFNISQSLARAEYEKKLSSSQGLYVNVPKIEKGVSFSACLSSLVNTLVYPANLDYKGEYGLALFSREGMVKEVVGMRTYQSFVNTFRVMFDNVAFTVDVAPDDYVAAVGRDAGGEWFQLPCDAGLKSTVDVTDTGAERVPVKWRLGPRIQVNEIYPSSGEKEYAWFGMPFEFYFNGASEMEAASIYINGLVVPVDNMRRPGGAIPIVSDKSYEITVNDYIGSEMLSDYHVTVSEPGTLEAVLGVDPARIKGIVLAGVIDERDIYYMRDCMGNLSSVDMSRCSIAAYGESKANYLPKNAFINVSRLTELVLPLNVEGIEVTALSNTGIKSVKFPASLNYLQGNCLPRLESLYVYALVPPDVFDVWHSPEATVLYVPVGTKELYMAHTSWNRFKDYIELPELGIASIDDVISGLSGEECVSVVDMFGRVVYTGRYKEIPALAPGVYVLNLSGKVVKVALR